jgi:hypothetical protein
MSRRAKLILLFYRQWAFASGLATAICVGFVALTTVGMLPIFLFFKVSIMALIWYVMREWGARRLYYFTNLGLSPRLLWSWSMAIDTTIFIICMAAAVAYNLSRI